MECTEDDFLEYMINGCKKIGRSLNDNRGLFHSFRDCRTTLLSLFSDIAFMTDGRITTGNWEIAFELRLNRARYIRIYADVVLITENTVFSMEFKMKKEIMQEEADQACKYSPYLEVIFGNRMKVVPVLVLTMAKELFSSRTACSETGKPFTVTVCSGDMLFNVLDSEMKFLKQ